jgi:hypothetical protein
MFVGSGRRYRITSFDTATVSPVSGMAGPRVRKEVCVL